MEELIMRVTVGLPGFLLAIVGHEAAHAYVAHLFGDDTAKNAGRVSLNPLVHLDMLGTVIFPLAGAMMGGMMFGWAKPVPVNPARFKNVRKGIFWVSFAGPATNVVLGIISGFLFGVTIGVVPQDFYLFKPFMEIFKSSVYINFILAAFNLIPFPPLDGSKMVSSFLDYNTMIKYEGLQRYMFPVFLVLLFTNVIHYLLAPAIFVAEWVLKAFFYMMV